MSDEFAVFTPTLQLSFFRRLSEIRERNLVEALLRTVEKIDTPEIDEQLAEFADADALRRISSFGMRGELLLPVPLLINLNPFLVGYYRLLYGFSQKEFYGKGPFGRFKRAEESGVITAPTSKMVPNLCKSLIRTGELFVGEISGLTIQNIKELQLLTLGAQWRGSHNNTLGSAATKQVFELIHGIVGERVIAESPNSISIKNDTGRIVEIDFFADPDVRIIEILSSQKRPLVSIEIKGGSDQSNIHNRLGEAEKSHIKAKQKGFYDFWTITRVDIHETIAREETPTTTKIFNLERLLDDSSEEYVRFREILQSVLSLKT